jgi:antitoxin MazE
MRTQVQKWGNSLAVRIPKAFAAELGLELDANVELRLEDGRLVICPAVEKTYQLTQLLEGITAENCHDEVDYGQAVGGELW